MAIDLVVYKKTPVWNRANFPQVFQSKHNTAAGTWAKLNILSGKLRYEALNENGDVQESLVLSKEQHPPLVQPQAWHRVFPLTDDLICFLEFLCPPQNYYQKKYGISAPHSEVRSVLEYVDKGYALELGCGKGRNSFFLNNSGFHVTALDTNSKSIKSIQQIVHAENLASRFKTEVQDIESLHVVGSFDLVLSTVVFQFLSPTSIEGLVQKMQKLTKVGGCNLIVAPISTPEHPCPIDFPFTFKTKELKRLYSHWDIRKYNENRGTFHRRDAEGNHYEAKFATLIAQKL
jgi:tellurite methyltransferase